MEKPKKKRPKAGRPAKNEKIRRPPYSKRVMMNAVKKSHGLYNQVAKYLGCSSLTAKKYIHMYPEALNLFLIAQTPMNLLALERFVDAVSDGEQWAIDRVLRRIPEEGFSPDPPKETPADDKGPSQCEELADLIKSLHAKRPE